MGRSLGTFVLVGLAACAGAPHTKAPGPPPLLRDGTAAEAGLDPAKLAAVDALVKGQVDAGKLPAAVVLIARHGVIADQHAYGVMDRGSSEPVAVDTIFDLESVTKIFSAAAAMSLVADGKLALDQPVAHYLPEFATGGKDAITVGDLLTHSNGLPLDVDLSGIADNDARWKFMLDTPPAGPPHTQVSYSDLGYRILGKVIEAAAGAPLDRVIHDRVAVPLGLTDTMYTPPASLRPRIAGTGVSKLRNREMRGEIADETDFVLGGIVACDGLFATAHDVATLAEAVLAGRPFPAASNRAMSTSATPWADLAASDHDWIASAFTGPKSIGWEMVTPHAYGGALSPGSYCKAGISGTFVCVDPTLDLIAVYLSNLMPAGDDLQGWYDALAPDRVFTAIRAAVVATP